MTATPPVPPIPARELRPGRGWYLVAVAVALGGLLAGVMVFAFSQTSLSGSLPHFYGRSNAESPLTVDLRRGQRYVIYVDNFEGSPACSGSGEHGGTVAITPLPGSSFTFQKGWSEMWDARYELTVSRDDRYRLTCGAGGYVGELDGELVTESYAVGEEFPTGVLVGRFFTALAALVGLSALGFLAGVVIALVTLVRRNMHKSRLIWQYRTAHPTGSSAR